MTDKPTSPARKPAAKKSGLLAAAASITKTVLGGGESAPVTVQLPQAVSEIHISPDEVIPAGTVITDDIAVEAGLDEEAINALVDGGHCKLVDVFVTAAPAQSAA